MAENNNNYGWLKMDIIIAIMSITLYNNGMERKRAPFHGMEFSLYYNVIVRTIHLSLEAALHILLIALQQAVYTVHFKLGIGKSLNTLRTTS